MTAERKIDPINLAFDAAVSTLRRNEILAVTLPVPLDLADERAKKVGFVRHAFIEVKGKELHITEPSAATQKVSLKGTGLKKLHPVLENFVRRVCAELSK